VTIPTGPAIQLTDPRELLEVYDAEGQPTGAPRTRRSIHLEGHWHLAFFCWIARPIRADGPREMQRPNAPALMGDDVTAAMERRTDRGLEILLQHRATRKDVWPLRFDASAAGHVRFGESLEQAAREVREELGIAVGLADMIPLGRHRQQHRHPNGLIDREHHALHLLTPGPPDAAYAPDPREVAGLAWIDADDLLGLVEGWLGRATVRYRAVDAGPDGFVDRSLTRSDLVPYGDGYHRRLVDAIRRHLRAG
jgi:isopentenyldiphosphate isomerase